MKYYAGIGSRETPKEICQKMTKIASAFEDLGYILRSGGADGADKAFEAGVKNPQNKEIYLPWKEFNGNNSPLFLSDAIFNKEFHTPLFDMAVELARKYHPRYDTLLAGAKRMMIRNMYQVLGWDLDRPVDFIICWTDDGSAKGGTGQALRYAMNNGIKIYNLYIDWEIDELRELYKQFKKITPA